MFPTSCRPSLTLVSKHWRRCFFECGELWRSLTLRPPQPSDPQAASWLTAKRALLRRVGASLEDLCLLSMKPRADCTAQRAAGDAAGSSRQLGALLDSLRPQQLPQLRSLAIDCDSVPSSTAATLHKLRQLRGLAVHARGSAAIPADVVQAAAQALCLLTSLELSSFAAPLPDVRQLTRLSGLVALALAEGQPGEEGEEEATADPERPARRAQPMQPPPPAAFPALKVCLLSSRPSRMQVGSSGSTPAVCRFCQLQLPADLN